MTGTDFKVSNISLGTGKFGNTLDENTSKYQLSYYVDKGYNLVDTARVYGNSEKVIGKWLKESNKRDKIVLASKGAHPDAEWNSRMTKQDIEFDIDTSLSILGTDYIDLYFLHRDDKNVPICEIIDILEDLCDRGKIRYYGCSNWTLDRIIETQNYAKKSGAKGFVCNQVMLSLTKANEELFNSTDMVQADKEMVDYHEKSNLTLMSYMTLAGGYFVKVLNEVIIPDHFRFMYENEDNRKTLEVIRELCLNHGYTPLELLLQYVLNRPFGAIPVVSFSSIEQMDETFSIAEKRINKEHMDILLKVI